MAWARRSLAFALAALLAAVIVVPHGAAQDRFVRQTIATGLEFPVSLAISADATPRFPAGAIFYSERFPGDIRVIIDGALRPELVANVTVATSGEQGLLGIALDPDFGTDPWIYAYHTYMDESLGRAVNRVVRFWLGVQPGPPGPPSMEVVLDGIPAASVHNGGVIGFAPDGTLLITTGDAQAPANSQDLTSVAGKILRTNPDGSVPTDNPFVGNPNANPYLYTFGHRNVFGLAFHPTTDRAYITENGPQCNDEVNLLIPGRNYGWGPTQTCSTPPNPPSNTNRDGPNPVLPIAWYGSVIAPTGLAFYEATNSSWQNAVLVGDWNRGALQKLDLGGADFDIVLGAERVDSLGPGGILDIETGPDGTVYMSTSSAIYRYFGPTDGTGGGTTPPPAGPPPILYVVLAIFVGIAGIIVWTVIRSRRTSRRP